MRARGRGEIREDDLHLVVDGTRAPAVVADRGLVVRDGHQRVRIDATGETKTRAADESA